MVLSLCCSASNLARDINILEMSNTELPVSYMTSLKNLYSTYKTRRNIFRGLRLLQVMGGFTITTLTTYNNPYFKDNTDTINIIVWYISISNNIFNLMIEKLSGYDLSNEKLRVKLLLDEGKKYTDSSHDYSLYPQNMKHDKLTYFNDMCNRIRTLTPYDFLTRDENDADHKDNRIHDKKTLRLREVWREITPPDGIRPPRRNPAPTVPGPPQRPFRSPPNDSENNQPPDNLPSQPNDN